MEKLLDKLSSYNLINNLLPGAIFSYVFKYFIGIDIIQAGIVENLFIYYFAGMIISRIGSLIIEPILIKRGFICYSPYSDYISASKKDDKIETLTETNNLYRTFIAGLLVIIIAKIYYKIGEYFPFMISILPYITMLILFFLFLFSFKKQTDFICKRVNKAKMDE